MEECKIPRRVYSDPEDITKDYEVFQKALGKRLQKLRRDRGFSLRDMTVLHGYAESQWRRMEREGVGTMQSLLRVAKALQTTVIDLLGGLGQYPKALNAPSQKAEASLPRVATWKENASALKGVKGEAVQEQPIQDGEPSRKQRFAK